MSKRPLPILRDTVGFVMSSVDHASPLRIAETLTQYGTGGIGRHIYSLSTSLKSRGHKMFLAGTSGDWDDHSPYEDYLDVPNLQVAWGGGALPNRLMALIRAARTTRAWLKSNKIDLIHAHESAPALVALVARLGLNIPLVVTYHGSNIERVQGFGKIAKHADLVVTPSFRAADDLAKIGGVPRDKLKVIGLGIDSAPASDPAEVEDLRKHLIGDGTHLVVTVARVTYQKGVDVLIDCIQQMSKTHPGYRFVVVGDGPELSNMEALAKEKAVTDKLIFAGRSENPFLYLRAADLMLLTSRWEALPVSIVEAFQTGTPVVATDCSGVHQLVDTNVGACVPIGDVDAICNAVASILNDDDKRQQMADAALERSKEDRFDPEFVHSQFEALYKELCQSGA